MANFKRDRINEEVRREVSEILSTVKDPRIPPMPSVVAANVTGDLEEARIYVSFFTEYDEKEVKQGLKAASGFVRKKLGERLKLRAVPKIIFILDHSIETGARINDILRGLNSENDAD
ncbi:MAG: 30S ribosome-binding factor RbfA [Clostridia bacterium]|nr:30S ribosome-binding factor RbfA [Clostridia bacterium]MBO5300057.1 30S ribosome-binding factor RbfA [Clostridia bacterium]MBQ4628733.1 30S ribosome-binding factor RbfA [Clostridia bacterium]